jgi:hypothetical protein
MPKNTHVIIILDKAEEIILPGLFNPLLPKG